MAKTPRRYRDIATRMIREQAALKSDQKSYEKMSRIDYQLPAPLSTFEYIRPFRSTKPYNSLRGARNALSNLEEDLHIHPITVAKVTGDDDSKASKELANRWETVLKWQMNKANVRKGNLRGDIVWSVALYDEVINQGIHLPTQFKAKKTADWREDAAYRYGEWAFPISNPQTIYMDHSEYMTERVMSVTIKTANSLLWSWPEAPGVSLKTIADREKIYVEYDVVDQDGRMVWFHDGPQADPEDPGTVLMGPEPWMMDLEGNQVPFLNWITTVGGAFVDLDAQHQRKPMLYPILQSEQWAMANLSGTLAFSEQLTAASQPKGVVTGPGADQFSIDYTDPAHIIRLMTGQTFEQLQSLGLDKAMMEILDRHEAAIQEATVADVLVTGRPISGEQAFASFNLQIQQAIASLGGIRGTSQEQIRKNYEHMLLVSFYTGSDIVGYSAVGEKYTIYSEDIDPNSIQMTVELKADVPADRVQRVTAAVTMARDLKFPTSRILKFLGESDAEGAMRDYDMEQVASADLAARIELLQRKLSGQYDEEVQAAAQALIEQLMQQQAEQQQQQGGPQPGPSLNGAGPPPAPGPGGQEFNPAVGGLPPSVATPEGATFEGATGTDRTGAPIATPQQPF